MCSVMLMTVFINSNWNSGNTIINTIDLDDGDADIDWRHYPTANIELSDSLQITKSGTYHLTGSLADGSVTIKAGIEGVIRLILDNVDIHNSNGPAICCLSGDDLVIELVGQNKLSDGENYNSVYDNDIDGAIYSKADLTFTGDGSLDLDAKYQDGIVSKDDLKIYSGTYNISARDDGIRGKDSIYILNGNFIVSAMADAIKVTNEIDQGKGFILIKDGSFKLISEAKGIKATNNILIEDGKYIIETNDDAIHSDNYIGISGGNINITAGDDGIHANRKLSINNGQIIVAKAYEGLEAQIVTIDGGEMRLVTTDDGINTGGGADESANNRPGANLFDGDEDCVLSINGGDIYINSSGDGIDSNGWLYFNGGQIIVDGPTSNINGALDAGMGIVMNGGKVFAIGTSGMAESLGSSSSVNNISIFLSSAYPAKTKISIKDSSGDTLVEHSSIKAFDHIAFGDNSLTLGKQYTLYLNDVEAKTFTLSEITTIVGNDTSRPPLRMMLNNR